MFPGWHSIVYLFPPSISFLPSLPSFLSCLLSLLPPSLPSLPFSVVPSWVLAVVIGICFSGKFYGLGRQVTGSLTYSITYLMYAIMITSGLVVHSLYLVECGARPCSQVSYAPATPLGVWVWVLRGLGHTLRCVGVDLGNYGSMDAIFTAVLERPELYNLSPGDEIVRPRAYM